MQEGDLVVRSGNELTSQIVKQFSKQDQTYSHSGIVLFENNYPFVYHIVPGDENPDERMRKDSLSRFCNPEKNTGFAIYRYDLQPGEKTMFKDNVLRWYREGVRFDSLFNFKSNDKMYCSEMITKGLASATGNRIKISTTQPTPFEAKLYATHYKRSPDLIARMQIVAIDNLYLNPHCRLVKRFDFTPKP